MCRVKDALESGVPWRSTQAVGCVMGPPQPGSTGVGSLVRWRDGQLFGTGC